MPNPSRPRVRATAVLAAGAGLLLALSACSPTSVTAGPAPASSAGSPLPDAHVHGLSVSSKTGQVLLATHDGLFDITRQPAAKIGTTNDLMGFTGGTDHGVLYASGHPGERLRASQPARADQIHRRRQDLGTALPDRANPTSTRSPPPNLDSSASRAHCAPALTGKPGTR
ncbi:UNVERIFIED_ORG: hypothetical protein ABIB19_000208 [Arthrobacter sp. UYEF10]